MRKLIILEGLEVLWQEGPYFAPLASPLPGYPKETKKNNNNQKEKHNYKKWKCKFN